MHMEIYHSEPTFNHVTNKSKNICNYETSTKSEETKKLIGNGL